MCYTISKKNQKKMIWGVYINNQFTIIFNYLINITCFFYNLTYVNLTIHIWFSICRSDFTTLWQIDRIIMFTIQYSYKTFRILFFLWFISLMFMSYANRQASYLSMSSTNILSMIIAYCYHKRVQFQRNIYLFASV